MNKTFWIGFIVVYVVMQCLGFFVHGFWLSTTYLPLHGTVFRPEAEMNSMIWMMFASSAVYVFVFCYIFTKGYEGKGVGEGVRYGLLMGLFMSVPMAVDQYVVYPLPSNLAITWFIAGLISFVIAGVVFSAIYRSSARTAVAATA